jgi:hypothetical protein
MGKMAVFVLLKVQFVSLAQLRVGSVLVPNSVSKPPLITGMVAAEASGALRPMAASAAMAMPQNWRMGQMFLAMIVLLGRFVGFIVFFVFGFFSWVMGMLKKIVSFGLECCSRWYDCGTIGEIARSKQ